jgi:two-component system cell cycle response regulator
MSDSLANLLLVEDNPGDARLFHELARASEFPFEIVHCETLSAAENFLADCETEVILLDLGLPDVTGLEGVCKIRQAAPDTPVIVLTGFDDESLAIEALKQGAQDYLVKGNIGSNTLRRALCYAMERQRVQLELSNLSLIDDLTGLYNRKGFLALGEHRMKIARRTRESFLVAFIDLDGLKQINDRLGHLEGNHALVDTANVLKDSFRQSDIIARLAGDEFAVFVADADKNSIHTVKQRVQQKIDRVNAEPTRQYFLSFSIGITSGEAAGYADLDALLAVADALMYEQKRSKRQTSIIAMTSASGQ